MYPSYPKTRMRRNRKSEWSRRIVSENNLTTNDLIWPIFLTDGKNQKNQIPTMPGVYRYSVDKVEEVVEMAINLKLPLLALFPHTRKKNKDEKGTEAFSDSEHPVFRTHEETGRKAIYVNRLMTEEVVELPKEESDRLLVALFDHSEKSEFVYEHIWNVGDVLLWDNRCSSHARTDFPDGERRLMLRTTIEGDTKPY